MNSLAIVNLELKPITLAPDALAVKQSILQEMEDFDEITCQMEREIGSDHLVKLDTFRKELEKWRKAQNAPVKKWVEDLNAKVKAFGEDLDARREVISGLIDGWEAKQAEILKEEQRKKDAEIARIALEAKKLADEEARKAQLAAIALTNAKNAEQRKILEEHNRLNALRAEESRKALEAERQKALEAVQKIPEAPKIKGEMKRSVACHEVLDLHELYKSNPSLCRIEANVSAINALILSYPENELPNIPGLKIWVEKKVSVKTS